MFYRVGNEKYENGNKLVMCYVCWVLNSAISIIIIITISSVGRARDC